MNCLVIGAAVVAMAQSTGLLERAGQAAAIVRESADALGGQERLAAAGSIRFGIQGEAYFPYQGPDPETPGQFNYGVSANLRFEPLGLEVVSGFTGGETAFTQTMNYDGDSLAAQSEFARQLRQSPHALIREWLVTPRNLVLTSETESHYIVSGAFHGRLAHAHINRQTRLVDRISVPFDDARNGDALAVAEYQEYSQSGSWTVPGRIRLVEAGNTIFDLPFEHYEITMQAVDGSSPDEPENPETSDQFDDSSASERSFEMPSESTFMHRDYGDGVRVLFNSGGFDYHALAVSTDEGVVVIETPGSVSNGADLIERASELGSVRFVAATHHHSDHSGGMAGAAGSSPTIVVAQAHENFFSDMITAKRHFLISPHSPNHSPDIQTVSAGGELGLGGKVIAYDAGPTGHSDAQLVFYVPQAKLLFQSDMAVFRWDGSVEEARTQTCRLQAFIAKTNLDVEVIVGGHGRPGTTEDLQRAIEQRDDQCNVPQ